MQKSIMAKPAEQKESRQWYLIDATDLILGRLSVKVADILRGKNKPCFTPNVDCGDYVIIINSDKIKLSGKKAENENWYNHSGYIGGLRTRSGKNMITNYSDELITRSIKGMLPHNKLSRQIIKKLFVYKKDNHPHEAQQPKLISIKGLNK